MNKVFLTGRWSKDIDFKVLDSGKELAKTSIAVEDGYGDRKQTYFFDVEIWGKLAAVVADHSGKGRKVLIEGRLKVEQWEKDGQKRYATKVVAENIEFLDFKEESSNQSNSNTNNTSNDPFEDNGEPIDVNLDDLPF